MNKLTTTLAGLAIVATASIAPAFAQGNFFTPGPFNFTFTPGVPGSTYFVSTPVTFQGLNSAANVPGILTLSGGSELDGGPVYTNTLLSFVGIGSGAGTTLSDTVPFSIIGFTGTSGYGIASFGISPKGDNFNLLQGQPVPEASTVISFGALLALGGLAVLRRKSVVKNAA